MPDSSAPPLRWFFDGAEHRAEAWRYWVRDTVVGVVNLGIHYSMLVMPIDFVSAVGSVLGAFAKYRYPASDARAHVVWRTLRPGDAEQADPAVRKLWRNAGRTMLEFSLLHRFWKAGRITVEGREHMDAARATGRPLIFLAFHLGNWETLGASLIAMGYPGAAIYMPPDNRFDHMIANRTRSRYGGEYIKPGPNAGREAIRYLVRKKQILLMYVDELARGRVWAPAFGRPLRTGGNLSYTLRIARKTNGLVMPYYCVRLGERANFKLTVLPPLPLAETADEDADLMANMAMVDRLIDPIIRAHLDQWFFALDFEFDK